MVRLEDLYRVYFMARSNKRRSEDAVVFEVNYEYNLKKLCDAINNRTYKADSNYTFICMRPKPREIFACEMEARVIQWYIVWRLHGIIEEELTKRTFNNRVGMGTDAAIHQVFDDIKEVTENYTKDAYVVQWDLKGFFPNAICRIVQEQWNKMIDEKYDKSDKEDLKWMLDVVINAQPQLHCYRKSPVSMWELIDPEKSLFNKEPGIGGAIGFLIWQTAMNLYINEIDHWLVDKLHLRYTRFVDDCIIVTRDKEYVLSLLPELRKRYDEYGCTMHPRKFYCQHYSKGVHFLGSYIKYNRIYIANKTLKKGFLTVKKWNSVKNKEDKLLHFQASINSYIGIFKTRSEFNNIKKIIDKIDDEWWDYFTMNWERICIEMKEKNGHILFIHHIYEKCFGSTNKVFNELFPDYNIKRKWKRKKKRNKCKNNPPCDTE